MEATTVTDQTFDVKCEYCEALARPDVPRSTIMSAQYDFVDNEGNWRYGCITHWQQARASRQLGPGHARHLSRGQQPEPRPPGTLPSPPVPGSLRKPQVRRDVVAPVGVVNGTPRQQRRMARGEARGDVARQVDGGLPIKEARAKLRPKHLFENMEPTKVVKSAPSPTSVLGISIALMRDNDGATLEEIQAAIGPKHDALKLLSWANENKGYGWQEDENKKIHVVEMKS